MLMGIDGSLIGTLQRQLLTSEVSRCDFWGTKARTETSRFKTLPEPLCRYCYQNTLLPAAWLSVPRDRSLSVSALCDSEPMPQPHNLEDCQSGCVIYLPWPIC